MRRPRGNTYLAVKAARAHQRGVERVHTVRGHDDLDVRRLVKTVHLVEQLEKDTLDLTVGARLRVEALGPNCVNLRVDWQPTQREIDIGTTHTRQAARGSGISSAE